MTNVADVQRPVEDHRSRIPERVKVNDLTAHDAATDDTPMMAEEM